MLKGHIHSVPADTSKDVTFESLRAWLFPRKPGPLYNPNKTHGHGMNREVWSRV